MHLISFFSAPARSLAAAAGLSIAVAASPVLADSDRAPVVLDTQTGIHDGRSGLVLQNAPLARRAMVPTQPTATLPEMAPEAQQPIVVAPYIELPGASDRRAVYRPRPAAGQ